MGCGCKGKVYNINMGCCTPVIAPADQYYTKGQIDEMIENIEVSACCITAEEVDEKIEEAISGITSGCCITPEEVDDKIEEATSGITPCDLSNYYNKQEVDNLINNIESNITQKITNIQEQINSLIITIGSCCGSTGETLYRWVTMTSENDYWCDGTTKKTLEKKQSSTDGLTWVDVVPSEIRSGSTILQYNSSDCGYDIGGMRITLNDDTTIDIDCEDVPSHTCQGNVIHNLTHQFIMSAVTSVTSVTAVKRIDIGTCVDQINADGFSGFTNLQKVVIPPSFNNKRTVICDGIDVNSFEKTAIRTVGMQGSGADIEWNNNMDEMAFAMFKGCTSLTSVELHSGFGTFDPYVFSGCTNLQSIILHSTTLPVLNSYAQGGYQYDALDGIGNNTFVIYVPANMVDTYKNAVDYTGFKNWSKYADHIQPIQ